MSTTTLVPSFDGTATWTVTAPDSVTVEAPSATTPFRIIIEYGWEDLFSPTAHGILDIEFADPAGGAAFANGLDLRLPVVFEISNDLGVPFDGFTLYLANEEFVANPPDITAAHPATYAHFHGIQPNTFPGQTLQLFTQDFFTPAAFGPAGNVPAPAVIVASGTIADGAASVGSMGTLHQVARPDHDDNFHLAFFPILTSGQTLLALTPAELAQAEGDSATTSFTFTVLRSGDSEAVNSNATSVDFQVVGSGARPTDAADFVGGTLPQGTLTFAPGETSKTITVQVAGDTAGEPDETFTLALTNAPSGAVIAADSAVATIENDDPVTLTVFGDDLDNTITISRNAAGDILVNGAQPASGPATVADTSLIEAFGRGGNDTIALDETNGALPPADLFGGPGNDGLTGGSGGDRLFGQGGNDGLRGNGGDDELSGRGGDDSLIGDTTTMSGTLSVDYQAGNDRLEGGAGVDSLYGDAPAIGSLLGAPGPGVFRAGDDWLEGGAGGDRLFGEALSIAANTLPGNDTLFGGGGDDNLYGDAEMVAGTVANAPAGDDRLFGGAGDDLLFGDTRHGSFTSGGNDELFGGGGNDFLVGGRGNDLIDGGAGEDTARFEGFRDAFSVERSGPGFTVVELATGDTDFVTRVEVFEFFDGAVETWLIA